ncbi:reverse transcriptase domain-containing protein [Tanacetum coccineum]|uniref:Reverse transcriptase domain-containing protein n=1 Tax=Tanacetum coccineum TaxID=301880 RepID=A0ABQ5I1C9_9ASTR
MDDEPMWAADRVVAPTPSSAITIPETANEFAIKGTIETWDELRTAFISRFLPPAFFDRLLREIHAFSQHENESLADAWLHMKEMLRNCHGHNLSKELQSHAKQPTPNLDDDDLPMSREEEAKFMKTFPINQRFCQRNIHGPQNSTRNSSKKQASIQNLETKFDRLSDKQSGRPSRSLLSNTQPNPQGSNSKAYQPPQARNEHVNVVFTRSGKIYNPPENPNEEQNKTKNPINFDSDDSTTTKDSNPETS